MARDDDVPHERAEPRPASLTKTVPREKLRPELQKIVDRDDSFFDQLYDG